MSDLLTTQSRLRPITLPEVMEEAGLQTRVDRKYFVPLPAFESLIAGYADRMRCLEIEGLRSFRYRSVYFDTPELSFYHQHLQGRRRRFKVRTRSYVDSGQCLLEVKSKGPRTETVKDRLPYQLDDATLLTLAGERFIAEVTGTHQYARTLSPVLETWYRRTTLVDHDLNRITCDTDLRYSSAGVWRDGPADEVLVETKSGGASGVVDRWLLGQGIRPHSVSKYCVGIALLHPHRRSNPWHRTMRRHFDWVTPARP